MKKKITNKQLVLSFAAMSVFTQMVPSDAFAATDTFALEHEEIGTEKLISEKESNVELIKIDDRSELLFEETGVVTLPLLEDEEEGLVTLPLLEEEEDDIGLREARMTALYSNGSLLTDWDYREEDGKIILEKYLGSSVDLVVLGTLDNKQVVLDVTKRDLFPESTVTLKIGDALNQVELHIERNNYNAFNNLINLEEGDFSGIRHTFVQLGFLKNMKKLRFLDLSNWDVSQIRSLADLLGSRDVNNALTNLQTIKMDNWDVSSVTSLSGLFSNCKSLLSIDLSSWADKTTNVQNINAFLQGCTALEEANLEGWDLPNVTHGAFFAKDCINLKKLNLQGWNFTAQDNLAEMFMNCESLEELDLSNWNISKVGVLMRMFANCYKLKKIDMMNMVNGSRGRPKGYTNQMFLRCWSLEELDLSSWDTEGWPNMNAMFYECYNLKTLKLGPNWNTSQVENMGVMFKDCGKLEALDVSNWDTSNVLTMDSMFVGTTSLKQLDCSNWDTSNVTNMYGMFNGYNSKTGERGQLESLNLSGWDTDQVETMYGMFAHQPKLQVLDLSSFKTDSIKTFTNGSFVGYGLAGIFNLSANEDVPSMIITDDARIKVDHSNPKGRIAGGVLYDANGGELSNGQTSGAFNDKIIFSSLDDLQTTDLLIATKFSASKEDDEFIGWYFDQGLTKKFEVDPNAPKNIHLADPKYQNTVLYAGWKSQIREHTVTFLTDQNGTMNPSVYTEKVQMNGNITSVPIITANLGYEFIGWVSSVDQKRYSSDEIKQMSIQQAMTFTAAYRKISTGGGSVTTYYNLFFDTNGGNPIPSLKVKENSTVELNQQPTKEGCIFAGWYREKEYLNQLHEIKMTSDKTVYAKWTQVDDSAEVKPEEEHPKEEQPENLEPKKESNQPIIETQTYPQSKESELVTPNVDSKNQQVDMPNNDEIDEGNVDTKEENSYEKSEELVDNKQTCVRHIYIFCLGLVVLIYSGIKSIRNKKEIQDRLNK